MSGAGSDFDPEEVAARLLRGPTDLTRLEVSRRTGIGQEAAARFWKALGFPNVSRDEAIFSAADVVALQQISTLVEQGVLDEDVALQLTRSLARSSDRLAVWQVQLVAEALTVARAGDPASDALRGSAVDDETLQASPSSVPDEQTAAAAADLVIELADRIEPLLVYAWRRHLADAVARMLADSVPATAEADPAMIRTIGFADLVSFTSLVRRLSERDLARVVQRFETLATDVVTAHGARVVKTVGDEVLFSSRGAAPAAAIALDLVDAIGEDPELPDVRVGMARGPVVARLGDVFGTTVNRASRLTALAHPNVVIVDPALARLLGSRSGFDLMPLRKRSLRGIGSVRPHVLRRLSSESRLPRDQS